MNKLAKYFAFKCAKGLKERIAKLPYKVDEAEYEARLKFEIGVIVRMGYPGYFLVVQDFIAWAKANDILVGDGRGSGAGSLAAYALGITNVDPIKYDLYFERFLNPDRVSMPDFDVDFQQDRRDEVIQYVKNKYGQDKVAQIGTFGTFKAKAAIKGVARTLNVPLQKANDLCKLYPKPVHGKEVKFKEAFEKVEELAALRNSDSDEGRILRWAEQIESRVASFGIHACLHPLSEVITNEGLFPIEQLVNKKDFQILTQHGFRLATVIPAGTKPVFKLRWGYSSAGRSKEYLIATGDHRIATQKGYVNLQDLNETHYLLDNNKNLPFPDIYEFAGWFWNDGGYSEKHNRGVVCFNTIKDQEAKDRYSIYWKSQLLQTHKCSVSLETLENIESLMGLGFKPLRHLKGLPYLDTVEQKISWLRGMLSANATIQRGALRLKLTSKPLIAFIRNLLIDLGIHCGSLSQCKTMAEIKGRKINSKLSYQFEVSTLQSFKLKNIIGLVQTYKRNKIPAPHFLSKELIGQSETYDFSIINAINENEHNGFVNGLFVHNSGVVIANEPLTMTVPLAKGKKDEVVTQWDMNNIEEAGLIKFDFLGLKTLSTIQLALQHIKKNHSIDIDVYNIDLDDQEVYANLRKGDTLAVFQLEASSGIRDLTVKVRPTNIEDISAINAMYRPGPLASPKMADYLAWRAGTAEATYHHPDLEPILAATGGWIVYQEQVLRIAKDMAGYTLAEADLLRRAVGKKKEKEMNEQKANLFSGFQKKGYPIELAQTLWDEIVAFSDYGFNKSHAVAYSIITYKTAWLKTHYPVEFMAAALTCDMGNKDQMIIYIQECKRMGIPVLPPDVNESGLDFTPANGAIRFGLSAIKNVGEAANHVIKEREARGPFKDLFDFAQRVDLGVVNKKKLESLVMAGAFDFTHQNRATLITGVDLIIAYKDDLKKYQSKLETYEKKLEACEQRDADIKAGKLSDKNKPLKPLKAPEKPIAPKQPEYISTPEFSRRDLLIAEKELTGSFISGHPLDGIEKKGIYTIQRLKEASGDSADRPDSVTLLAIISDIELKETKTKQRMAFLTLEDLTGTIEAVIFPQGFNRYQEMIMKNVPLLIHANVEYADIENDETETGFITIPSLKIQSLDIVGTAALQIHETLVDVPLTMSNILAVNKAVQKAGKGEHKIRLSFTTQSSTILSPSTLIEVPNEREFKTEIYRNSRR